MIDIKHHMVIDGKSSKDFDMYISGGGTYSSPEKSYEEVDVPGRNGVIFLYDGNYKNVDVTYNCFIAKVDGEMDVDMHFRDLRSYLMSREGYVRIEDTYHPGEIRFGTYNEAIEPDVHETLTAIQFTLTFSCKPQRFIKKFYDQGISYTSSGQVFRNDTYFNAKPLIRAYGTGNLTVNGTTVRINSANSYTDIDCDLQEAYKDTLATNCNGNITLNNAQFPYLKPGDNSIAFSGISSLVMYPRTYML